MKNLEDFDGNTVKTNRHTVFFFENFGRLLLSSKYKILSIICKKLDIFHEFKTLLLIFKTHQRLLWRSSLTYYDT